uniref:secretagogin-like isoform X2 n=1 Tax=Oncorhynchus gorbuscha TaxID=8017 RepID=UPI001EAF0453|nr:secretagogin-like isoform X2 [Oncorhynchus gorbuscha]XP_046193711.1 secretagogin-like isoform X2 [Oncorhynchus gorbuscha]
MDCAFELLDAVGFLEIWQHFDADDNGYIEGKELDHFFRHMMTKLGPEDKVTEERVQRLKQRFMSAYDVTADGRLQIQEIWRKYDADSSGYISAVELKGFLKDLFQQHGKAVSSSKLDEYTDAMMKIFDKNKDGRLDLNDLSRILALEENFMLQFKMDASSQEDRKRDFDKIFNHYDVSNTGALEGPEVDGFVKDMMELVRPSITGPELDKLRAVLLGHCDVNKDGKIQRNELALCLGMKPNKA